MIITVTVTTTTKQNNNSNNNDNNDRKNIYNNKPFTLDDFRCVTCLSAFVYNETKARDYLKDTDTDNPHYNIIYKPSKRYFFKSETLPCFTMKMLL